MLDGSWSDILELANRAPSPHNVQPWKVEIGTNTSCTVYIDLARTLPKEDETGSFIISGMVMYIESMRYAAQIYGYRLKYKLFQDQPITSDNLQLFAHVNIIADNTVTPEYSKETMLARRTSRLGHVLGLMSVADQQLLRSLSHSYSQTYSHTSDAQLVEAMLALNINALFQDLNKSSYHDEIVSWFRFSTASSKRYRDGLDARCMKISNLEYRISAMFPLIFKIPLINVLLAKRYRRILGDTTTIGWISGKFWQFEEAVNAGKFLMHFWLELTRLGFYLHPLGNLVTNRPARDQFEKQVTASDIWFVFRVGHTKTPPDSYRLPLKDILIEKRE